MSAIPDFAAVRGADLEIRVKAVPGARREEVAGVLGDRLKIRVVAPPEGGRANAAIVALLAARLGVPERAVVLVQGAGAPLKVFRIVNAGTSASETTARLLG